MKQDIPNADIQEHKVYFFNDGEVYTAQINESFYNNFAFKYKETRIDESLARIIYDVHNEVKFSNSHNAMEFSDADHFNRYIQQEGYGLTKHLMGIFNIKEKK